MLTLTFLVKPGSVHVDIVGSLHGGRASDDDTELSDQILDAVVDEHELDLPHDRVSVTKRLQAATAAGPTGEPVSG
jgi:hypothetical protein